MCLFQNGDVKNTDVYEWFNCMEIGPCHGWMSTNQTLRRLTTKRARQLTRVLKDMAAKLKFDSFDLHFTENPFKTVITEWLDAGGELWELIEPVDSLHPTQAAQPLIAKTFWKIMEKQMPNVLGPVNNRNKKIRNLFGDQNGH
jgi:acyloxyacyl hydrolase